MDLGNQLRTLRIRNKIEPVIIADMLKISINTYRRYERNESAPDLNMLAKIAEIHNLTVMDILREDSPSTSLAKDHGENSGIINHLSEKLIEQYTIRINDKDEIIEEQKQSIQKLKKLVKEYKEKILEFHKNQAR